MKKLIFMNQTVFSSIHSRYVSLKKLIKIYLISHSIFSWTFVCVSKLAYWWLFSSHILHYLLDINTCSMIGYESATWWIITLVQSLCGLTIITWIQKWSRTEIQEIIFIPSWKYCTLCEQCLEVFYENYKSLI